MILDHIRNAGFYTRVSRPIAAALDFIQRQNPAEHTPGRIDLDGGAHALLLEYETKPRAQSAWEAHRQFIDVQYIVEGEELFGYADLMSLAPGKYDETRDVLTADGHGDTIHLTAGHFIILGPEDAHVPALAVDDEPRTVRKIVVKIPA
jgi:YhcH/YjgK/YiaL family protein